jgi:hypothetical protein
MSLPNEVNLQLLASSKPYNIDQSLRFRASATAYLNRTPASAGNRKVFTYSSWVKRGTLSSVDYLLGNIVYAGSGATNEQFNIYFGTDNCLEISSYANSGFAYRLITTQVFRDPSAWYHIVIAFDTTQATDTNRIKVYVNGSQITSFSTSSYPSLNYDTYWNRAIRSGVGALIGTLDGSNYQDGASYFDGYMAEINFIDGSALTPSSFGQADSQTGVWQPKKYGGSYGTNGFYLPFSNTSSTSTLGNDFSGNSNTWTVNNISLTAGSTYDFMRDSPTLGTLASNYATLNPLRTNNGTLINANLTASSGSDSYKGFSGTMAMKTGKWYWEVTCTSIGFVTSIGITNSNSVSGITTGMWSYHYDGSKYIGGSNGGYGASYASGDVLGFAFDADAGSLTCYKNNSSQGVLVSGLPSNVDYYPYATLYGSWNIAYNFGQRPFAYTPPSGFNSLNTFNLPTPTIGATSATQANKNFDVTLYTGNGGIQSLTMGFAPDLAWQKSRSIGYAGSLYDSVRGTSKQLSSATTDAEDTRNGVTAFNSNGVTLGDSARSNDNGQTFVNWAWKAGGAAVTNTAGSISAQVSANPTAGFSVVTYTGNGTNGATVGHGLGVAPSMIFVKDRSQGGTYRDWAVYSPIIGAGNALFLNDTTGSFSKPSYWNSTTATSTVFTLGNDITVNQSGDAFVAYCWTPIAGYSAIGSYTGNGSTDGTFVYTGFRPRFILRKWTNGSNQWVIFDTSRDPYNLSNKSLYTNVSNAEETLYNQTDILSNGFKMRTTDNSVNGSGGNYIYAAFAENPFKYANAR